MKIPLLVDHHTHFSLYAALMSGLSVAHCSDKKEVLALLAAMPDDELSIVFGLSSGRIKLSEKELEQLPPLIINDVSLHGFLLTSRAKEQLKIIAPALLEHYQDSIWRERHTSEILNFMVYQSALTAAKMDDFVGMLSAQGIIGGSEMMLASTQALAMIEQGPMVGSVCYYTDDKVWHSLPQEAKAKIKGLKYFTDGSIGAKSAALSQPYDGTHYGKLIYSDQELDELLQQSRALCDGVAIHALGDAATSQVLRVLRDLNSRGISFSHLRIEHAEFITADDARKARDLGAILSMQPNFTADVENYRDRLSAQMLTRVNPFRMLIDEIGFIPGKDLIFGSDGMPHGPLAALNFALFPPCPQQRLSLDEFTAGYSCGDMSRGYLDINIDNAGRKVTVEAVNCNLSSNSLKKLKT